MGEKSGGPAPTAEARTRSTTTTTATVRHSGSPQIDDAEGALRAAMKRMEAVLVDALGLGERRNEHGDVDTSTHLSYERTDLALDRTYMAGERTLQAWIRTTLSMISFGFTLGKLAQVLQDVEVKGLFRTHTLSITGVAYVLVILGIVSLLAAIVQHGLAVRELRARGLRRRVSIASIIALLLVVVGGFAFTSLVLNL